MLYNVNINIPYCCKHWLKFEHASLLVLFMKSQTWADTMEYEGKVYYRLNMTKIKSDLPILSDKDDTIYRYIKTLIEKWMVEKVPKVDYYRCTTLWIEYDYHTTTINNNDSQSDESEKNPTPIGKKSESEKFPTYNNTNVKDNNDYSITNNILSKDNTTSDDVVDIDKVDLISSDPLNTEKEKEKNSAKKEKEVVEYGRSDINNLVQHTKQTMLDYNIPYNSQKERQFANFLLSKKYKEDTNNYYNMSIYDYITTIIYTSTKLKYAKKINSLMTIYYNGVDILYQLQREGKTINKSTTIWWVEVL